MRYIFVILTMMLASSALAHPHHECKPSAGDLHCDKEHSSGKEHGK